MDETSSFARTPAVRTWCLISVACAACAATPVPREPPGSPEIEPDPVAVETASTSIVEPDPATAPTPPPGLLGANPGCPAMRVFRDDEHLCTNGIMPTHAFGSCERLLVDGKEYMESSTSIDSVEALGGTAQLFIKGYLGSYDATVEDVYLGLTGPNGQVLLAQIGSHDSRYDDALKIVSISGAPDAVEVEVRQKIYPGPDEPGDGTTSRETIRCERAQDGGIRCGGTCPELAVALERPPLDCQALAAFDWSRLPRGRRLNPDDWGGRFADEQFYAALSVWDLEDERPVQAVREVEIENRVLTILKVAPRRWVMLEDSVPLFRSVEPIQVGPAPGGIYVRGGSATTRKIKRLHVRSHELEPVSPGPCTFDTDE
ncbi:MAG: hypothetical protein AAF799_45625 [Myxococcota bacterium]